MAVNIKTIIWKKRWTLRVLKFISDEGKTNIKVYVTQTPVVKLL